jgi:cysteine-rich repeat protein
MIATNAGSAFAQVDCNVPGGCSDLKYGLGVGDFYRKDEFPPDQFRFIQEDFGDHLTGISYFVGRTDPDDPTAIGTCGPERNFSPLPGQVILREQATNCTPTGTGPTCTGGTSPGAPCHLMANPAQVAVECPGGGTCTDNGGGCRVEIPLEGADGGTTPFQNTSELKIFTYTFQGNVPGSNPPRFYNLQAQTGNTFGGTSATTTSGGQTCPLVNRRLRPSMGTRYLLSDARRTALNLPAGPTYTYVRWDGAYLPGTGGLNLLVNPQGCVGAACRRANEATNFRFHTDDTRLCCDPNQPGDCAFVLGQNSPEYPLLTSRQCNTTGRPFTNDDNIAADWIFLGGRNSRFFTDINHVNPGNLPGLCKVNRFQDCYAAGANAACSANKTPFQCCTGAGVGTCGNICPSLDADPLTAGVQPDSCDFTEPGHRIQVACGYDSQGDARRDCCANAIYVLRGQPSGGCGLLPRMQYDGDPGTDCSVANYGIDHRWDNNCDGTADFQDFCPFLTEWDQDADSNGDCSDGLGGDCRGDECECGDLVGGPAKPPGTPFITGNGSVNVADLVAINIAIFNPNDGTKRGLLADTNNDLLVNVSDIIGANLEIFRPDSSVCRQISPRTCGSFCQGGNRPGQACTVSADCGTGTCVSIGSPCCGDGTVTSGEPCDDGDLQPSDGCNASCRIEFGYTCTGSPSVCTN